jgi:hypothetical protein
MRMRGIPNDYRRHPARVPGNQSEMTCRSGAQHIGGRTRTIALDSLERGEYGSSSRCNEAAVSPLNSGDVHLQSGRLDRVPEQMVVPRTTVASAE